MDRNIVQELCEALRLFDSESPGVLDAKYHGRLGNQAADTIDHLLEALRLIEDMEPEHPSPEARWMAGVARAALAKAGFNEGGAGNNGKAV